MTGMEPGWPNNRTDGLPQGAPQPPERQGPLAVFGPGMQWTAEEARRATAGHAPPPYAPEWPAAPPPYAPPYAPPNFPPRRFARPTRRISRRRGLGLAVTLALVVALCVGSGALTARLLAFGAAISPRSPLSTQTGYMSVGRRVNVAVLGYGGVGHDGAYLTDSIMVISFIPSDRATTLVSVPRDLWVQVPPDSGQYAKLNTAFQDGMENGYAAPSGQLAPGQMAGGLEAAAKVSDITGLHVPYFLSINFQGFRELVDALGGVDVNVPVAFTAQYPINDDPQINAGWKIIHFAIGPQHMNGEQAIEYARARYVLSPASEGSDFARSARQQLLIRAIVSRLRSPAAWPGLSGALDALQRALYTNLSLTDLTAFTLKLDLTNAAHVQLTDGNALVDAQSADGQDILLPRDGDWGAIRRYIAGLLKS